MTLWERIKAWFGGSQGMSSSMGQGAVNGPRPPALREPPDEKRDTSAISQTVHVDEAHLRVRPVRRRTD